MILVVSAAPEKASKPASGSDQLVPPTLGACAVFPSDNIWNQRIDKLPVHSRSSEYIAAIGATAPLHSDFGSGFWPPDSDSPMGIPYKIVGADQEPVAITFTWPDESDPGPYPIPPDAPVEGGPNGTGDRHVLILDSGSCMLYELYNALPLLEGTSWKADSGAVFDLKSNQLRPYGWTSADAAGLPILPGLVRYDEVASGEIRHAIRVTAPNTQRAFLWPARHFASHLTALNYPPMGLRLRLKASYNISRFTPEVQVILRALKTYGLILADNGSPWYLTGAPDPHWDNDALHQLHEIQGSNFEAVDVSSLMIDQDSAAAKVGPSFVYPQLALGGGFACILMVSNFGTSDWTGTALLNNGTWPGSWNWSLDGLDQGGKSDFSVTLGPGETRSYVIGGFDTLRSGWLSMEPAFGFSTADVVTAFFFQFRESGRLVDSTGVASASASTRFRFPVAVGGETDTGVAVRGATGELHLSIFDEDGSPLGEVTRDADGAFFVGEIFENLPEQFNGSVVITGDAPFYATVLRQDIVSWTPLSFQLTAIPGDASE